MANDDPAKPRDTEPQSYGSQADWLTGRTGQTVDGTPEKASRHDEEFYKSKRDDRGRTAEGPAQRSPLDDTLENDPVPDPAGTGWDIPHKPA